MFFLACFQNIRKAISPFYYARAVVTGEDANRPQLLPTMVASTAELGQRCGEPFLNLEPAVEETPGFVSAGKLKTDSDDVAETGGHPDAAGHKRRSSFARWGERLLRPTGGSGGGEGVNMHSREALSTTEAGEGTLSDYEQGFSDLRPRERDGNSLLEGRRRSTMREWIADSGYRALARVSHVGGAIARGAQAAVKAGAAGGLFNGDEEHQPFLREEDGLRGGRATDPTLTLEAKFAPRVADAPMDGDLFPGQHLLVATNRGGGGRTQQHLSGCLYRRLNSKNHRES